jgi:hypothetical protein
MVYRILEGFHITDSLLDKRDDKLHVTLLCAMLRAG